MFKQQLIDSNNKSIKMNIEIISGSPRKESLTRRVALHLRDNLKKCSTYNIGLIDLQEWNLPPIETVFSSIENTPDAYKPLTKRMFEANAFIFVSPEYNGSYSSAMKNLLDHFTKLHHKAIGIVTASPGGMGGIRAAQQMQLLSNALFGICSPYMLLVAGVDKKFDETGILIDEKFENNIHNFITEFLWLAESTYDKKLKIFC